MSTPNVASESPEASARSFDLFDLPSDYFNAPQQWLKLLQILQFTEGKNPLSQARFTRVFVSSLSLARVWAQSPGSLALFADLSQPEGRRELLPWAESGNARRNAAATGMA